MQRSCDGTDCFSTNVYMFKLVIGISTNLANSANSRFSDVHHSVAKRRDGFRETDTDNTESLSISVVSTRSEASCKRRSDDNTTEDALVLKDRV